MPGQEQRELQARVQAHATRKQQQPAKQSPPEDEVEDTIACHVAWSSGSKQSSVDLASSCDTDSLANKLKLKGNAAVKAGLLTDAVTQYGLAIRAAQADELGKSYLATLYSNRAFACFKLAKYVEAAIDAGKAIQLCPAWPKPYFRLAQAQAALCQCGEAVRTCRKAEALYDTKANVSTDFTPLLDQIAVCAAREGSHAGFDGRQLEVRSAGDDAWLGRPAPEDPDLDYPPPPLSLPASLGSTCSSEEQSLQAGTQQGRALTQAGGRPWSFRSMKDAVAAAQDGDQVLLLKGIHNGLGECLNIDKRILIRGEGLLGETRIDQRANCPTFRISRNCVIQNIDVDMTGFREAIMVTGPKEVQPLIEDCIIRCSGDDAVNVCGTVAPLFRRCTLQGRKCGVRAFDATSAVFESCIIEECGKQGVLAMARARPRFKGCRMCKHEAECVVGMDSSHVQLIDCELCDSQGPGIDLSSRAQLTMTAGCVTRNVGGVWCWDVAKAVLSDVALDGGKSLVVLAQDEAQPQMKECHITGNLRATRQAWEGMPAQHNTIMEGERLTFLPPEDGPFQFLPNKFTRKQ
ncbi:hypothetical protein WJX72_001708 [[Myrmecia] bisecta]|uniref:Right handed beta helix domain-containing protein n=1 Tax=[Myrmecia] bisecta TaxID=41462 RepID=A0AAW1R415_9CHLO